MMKRIITTTILSVALLSAAAQIDTTFVAKGNPIVNYKYMGDPAALVHDGTLKRIVMTTEGVQ